MGVVKDVRTAEDGEREAIKRMQATESGWFALCARHLEAALRPQLDGYCTVDADQSYDCAVCRATATHEYYPGLEALTE